MTTDNRPIPYSLRLEPEIREQIEQLAKAGGRSLNAQIVMMLNAYLNSDGELEGGLSEKFKQEIREYTKKVINDELRNKT